MFKTLVSWVKAELAELKGEWEAHEAKIKALEAKLDCDVEAEIKKVEPAAEVVNEDLPNQ